MVDWGRLEWRGEKTHYNNWKCAPNTALSNMNKEVEINGTTKMVPWQIWVKMEKKGTNSHEACILYKILHRTVLRKRSHKQCLKNFIIIQCPWLQETPTGFNANGQQRCWHWYPLGRSHAGRTCLSYCRNHPCCGACFSCSRHQSLPTPDIQRSGSPGSTLTTLFPQGQTCLQDCLPLTSNACICSVCMCVW